MNIEIRSIDTKPEHDPYANIEGIVSTTTLWLDPESRLIGVEQEYRTNSTSMDRWHYRELTWRIPDHPSEEVIRNWIENRRDLFERICDGYEREWNGNNHIGTYSEDAHHCIQEIEEELDSGYLGNYWEYWTVESWLESSALDVTAEMTDEELAQMADALEPTEPDILVGRRTILEELEHIRDEKRWEKELELE